MEKKTENKLLIILIIILLLSIFSYIIYLNGILIYDENNINYNNHNINMVEPDNSSSRPVKGIEYKDSLDSLHIPHIIFDKELNCYAISLAGNKLEDIANYDELVKQMNRLEYNRNKYKDCTIEDIKLVDTHCTDNIHQAAEAIRYNLSHKDNPYNEGYDAGYNAGYETAKRELENK